MLSRGIVKNPGIDSDHGNTPYDARDEILKWLTSLPDDASLQTEPSSLVARRSPRDVY